MSGTSSRIRRLPVSVARTSLVAVIVGALGPWTGPATAQSASADSADPLRPDTVLAPAGVPRMAVLRAPGSPVVALRVSIPVTETPSEAGAARMLVELAVSRARSLAGPVSARIEGQRTPGGIAYTVTGAAHDFDYLSYLLRITVAEPQPGRIDFLRVRNRLVEEARRAGETPSGRMLRQLRERAFPEVPPLDGTVGSLQTLQPETLRRVWSRSHGPSRLTVVVAGDLPRELLLASLQGMGARGEPEAPSPAPAPPGAGGEPQVLRRWYGEARVLPAASDPRGEVAALLVSGHLREVTDGFESHVELWQADGRRALAVIGAAYRASATRMRDRVSSALGATASGLTEAAVEAAVGRVRRDLLFEARTPWGRVAVVGRHLEGSDDPGGARAYLDALDRVDTASIRSYLQALAATTPIRTEVNP